MHASSPAATAATSYVKAYGSPPPGFNPLSASDAELAQYGFPPRPDPKKQPKLYKHWLRMMSAPRQLNPTLQQTHIYNEPTQ
jgi:hypothetical protein